MDTKTKVQYVTELYIVDSLAKQRREAEQERKQTSAVRAKRPEKQIQLDPFAVAAMPVAVVLLVVLVLGALQFRADWMENANVKAQVEALTQKNNVLETSYRSVYDMDSVQAKAEEKGMVPASEAEVRFLTVTVPEAKKGHSLWDNFLWFMSGLLERKTGE